MAERQIILADNQDITRLGLKTLVRVALKDVEDLAVKELSRRAELIAELKENPSSVVVIDYTKFDLASSDELLNLSERFPFAMWVLFSDDLTEQLIRRLSVEQQFSMILKDDSAQEIVTALKCAITGVRFLCHQVTNLLLTPSAQQSLAERDQLTATEKEVLRQIALGKSVKEIAVERNSSIHTITTHKKNIFRKINVNTIYEATKYALRAANDGRSVTIEQAFENWKGEANERFAKLKQNEEKLNQIFIDIYGLGDELAPDVDDKDITVSKADLQREVRSLISYAVGCMFGRYSLGRPGLIYAGGEWDESIYSQFKPDKDAIIPICDDEYFDDDIVGHFVEFVEIAFGKETLECNLNFITGALGGKGKGSSREILRN